MGSAVRYLHTKPHKPNAQTVRAFDTLVIIPAYNEAKTIVSIINDLHQLQVADILVVDDASTDGTGRLAEETGKAHVIRLVHNLGIGGCVQTGFKFANMHHYEQVLQFDGDGQHLAVEVPRLLKLLILQKSDVVVGSRFTKKHTGYRSSYRRRLGISLLRYLTMMLIHQRIKDTTSGFRAYNRKAAKFLAHNYPTDYPEPEALILLGKNGFKISEVFTQMKPRQAGSSSLKSRGLFYMFKVSLAMIMTYLRPKSI